MISKVLQATLAFLLTCAAPLSRAQSEEGSKQLKQHIANEDWSAVEKDFEDLGKFKDGRYEIEFAPQCWKSVADTKARVAQQVGKFESDLRLCKNPSNTGVSGRAKCLRTVRTATDLCGRGGAVTICQGDRCESKEFSYLPKRLHGKFDEEYMAAVVFDHQADRASSAKTAESDNGREHYEDSKNPSCAWFYYLPEIKGVAMNENLAGIMGKKAGVTSTAVLDAIAEGQQWTDYAFSDAHIQRKPPPMPKFFFGSLNSTDMTPEQLAQHFGRAARNDMSLAMIPNRIQVRFVGLATKPPCGQTIIKYSRAYEKDGVLVLHNPQFFPSRRGP